MVIFVSFVYSCPSKFISRGGKVRFPISVGKFSYYILFDVKYRIPKICSPIPRQELFTELFTV